MGAITTTIHCGQVKLQTVQKIILVK